MGRIQEVGYLIICQVSGPTPVTDGSYGNASLKDASSEGEAHIVREFPFGDTSVGDELTSTKIWRIVDIINRFPYHAYMGIYET